MATTFNHNSIFDRDLTLLPPYLLFHNWPTDFSSVYYNCPGWHSFWMQLLVSIEKRFWVGGTWVFEMKYYSLLIPFQYKRNENVLKQEMSQLEWQMCAGLCWTSTSIFIMSKPTLWDPKEIHFKSETADLLGFSHLTISKVYRKCPEFTTCWTL